jgi:hypothetical protein
LTFRVDACLGGFALLFGLAGGNQRSLLGCAELHLLLLIELQGKVA